MALFKINILWYYTFDKGIRFMEEIMFERLNSAKKRLAEIDKQLMDENIAKDINLFKNLSKERANLEPQVSKFNEYLKTIEDKQQAFEMSKDNDNDIAEMGKEEYKRLSNLEETIIDELNILLIPKDKYYC